MKLIKKTIFSVFIFGSVFTSFAQDAEENKVEEKVHYNQFYMLTTSLADQIVQFGYERKFSKNNSAMVQLGMYLEGTDALEDPTVNGAGIRLEANYNMIFDNMISKDNHKLNFYISPYVNYFNANFKIGSAYYNTNYATIITYDTNGIADLTLSADSLANDVSAKINHFGIGAIFGLRWTISERLVLDFYTGGGAQMSNYIGEDKLRQPLRDQFIGNFTTQGVIGRGGIRIGILF